MSVSVDESLPSASSPEQMQKKAYQQSLANKIRRANEMEQSPGAATTYVGTADSEAGEDQENSSSLANHFQVPNLSSMLYEFTNREQEKIQSCFRIGNFNSLRDLPKHLLPGNVSYMSSAKINENLYGAKEERSYIELQKGGGYFSKFEYREDPYSLFLESEKQDRYEKAQKQIDLHQNKPFINTTKQEYRHAHQIVFRPKDFPPSMYGNSSLS